MKNLISHKVFWGSLIIVAIVLVVIFTRSVDNGTETKTEGLNCVPAPTCHPTTCIPESEYVPNPDLCTQDCQPGTLDCGFGYCEEVNGECQAVIN